MLWVWNWPLDGRHNNTCPILTLVLKTGWITPCISVGIRNIQCFQIIPLGVDNGHHLLPTSTHSSHTSWCVCVCVQGHACVNSWMKCTRLNDKTLYRVVSITLLRRILIGVKFMSVGLSFPMDTPKQ